MYFRRRSQGKHTHTHTHTHTQPTEKQKYQRTERKKKAAEKRARFVTGRYARCRCVRRAAGSLQERRGEWGSGGRGGPDRWRSEERERDCDCGGGGGGGVKLVCCLGALRVWVGSGPVLQFGFSPEMLVGLGPCLVAVLFRFPLTRRSVGSRIPAVRLLLLLLLLLLCHTKQEGNEKSPPFPSQADVDLGS